MEATKKEVRDFYKENGWRETVSKFKIAPKDLSPIVNGAKKKTKKKTAKKTKGAIKKNQEKVSYSPKKVSKTTVKAAINQLTKLLEQLNSQLKEG